MQRSSPFSKRFSSCRPRKRSRTGRLTSGYCTVTGFLNKYLNVVPRPLMISPSMLYSPTSAVLYFFMYVVFCPAGRKNHIHEETSYLGLRTSCPLLHLLNATPLRPLATLDCSPGSPRWRACAGLGRTPRQSPPPGRSQTRSRRRCSDRGSAHSAR